MNSLNGLTLETALMFIPALGYLFYIENQGVGFWGHTSWELTILLCLAGVVTAIPLLLFSFAAKNIPLSTLGLLQYIAPTLQFIIGVFVYSEPFTHEGLIGFGVIWLALILFSIGGVYERRKALLARPA